MADDQPSHPRELLAEFAHELANPLAVARGFTTELLSSDRPDGDVAAIQAIDRNIKVAMHLLDTYREAARGDGPMTLDLRPVGLTDLVDSTVADLQPMFGDRPVDVDHTDGQIEIVADTSRLRQVLFNLLSNAVKHTPAGTPIRLRTWLDHDQAVVEVADDGYGVATDLADTIFEPRTRGNTATDGLGIGLHVARKITEAHGGRLELAPAQTGAAFRVTLPIEEPAPALTGSNAHVTTR